MPQRPPRGLGTRGSAFWRAVTGAYELRPDELRLLADACREMALVDRLEDELRGSPLMVKGCHGQPVASPLVQEVRQHPSVLRALLRALSLPDDVAAGGRGGDERSASARHAAQVRWGRVDPRGVS